MLAFLVSVAGFQRLPHPFQYLIIEFQPAQQVGELLFDNFLANIWLVAPAFKSGAMIIDVTLLLDLPNDRAAAVPAGDKA
ncbi:MAG: hypothetical protein WAV78_52485 [Xanthobacteraceae bacterium]